MAWRPAGARPAVAHRAVRFPRPSSSPRSPKWCQAHAGSRVRNSTARAGRVAPARIRRAAILRTNGSAPGPDGDQRTDIATDDTRDLHHAPGQRDRALAATAIVLGGD